MSAPSDRPSASPFGDPARLGGAEACDQELVVRSSAGDRDAFAILVERYQRLVFGVAVAITRDRAAAEDVGQDTFVAAWRGLAGLTDRGAPAPWFAGIARNLANNMLRKRARRREPPASTAAPPPTPLDHTLDRERDALLRTTLDELPHAQREALVLYYLEDRSVEQVASGLGVTRDVVKQRLHRAREAVRARLTERYEPAFDAWRPSAAFAGAVIAAIATATVTEAAAATTSGTPPAVKGTLMLTKIAAAVVSVLVAGTTVFYVAVERTDSSSAAAAPPSTPAPHATAATAASAPTAPSKPHVLARIGTQHAQLADAIASKRQHRAAPPAAAVTGRGGCADGSADCTTAYIRDATVAILPLLKQCVENREFDEGTVRIRSMIETEPDVGAIVTAADIVEDGTTIKDPDIRECIRETMYAIELDPAAVSGTLAFETVLRLADTPAP
jgi:RNA polymerase sigma factor (sigma-70 family)